MPKNELDNLEKEIRETFKGGGPYAHNVITIGLQRMATLDKERADKLYQELQDEGF